MPLEFPEKSTGEYTSPRVLLTRFSLLMTIREFRSKHTLTPVPESWLIYCVIRGLFHTYEKYMDACITENRRVFMCQYIRTLFSSVRTALISIDWMQQNIQIISDELFWITIIVSVCIRITQRYSYVVCICIHSAHIFGYNGNWFDDYNSFG